ncbi:MAG TPA: M48 family metalloprotease, partial [Gaiellaceae bacterium]|nr:M48 family metalloprotease [Gaiellaceae bacterium]
MRTIVAARNLVKTWLLVLGLSGMFAFAGWALGGVRLLSIFVFCALLLLGAAYWMFDRAVLGMAGARELPLAEAPLLHSTVERLAALAGVAKPRLYLIPDGLPRALATGRGVRSSAIAVSAGCVSACPPAELEGVLAHELAHVRLRDVQVQTAVVVFAGAIVESSRIGGW